MALVTCSICLCAADLSVADWTVKLRASGWQENLPTVWVAEGLLYYVEATAVTALLKGTHFSAGSDCHESVCVGYTEHSILSSSRLPRTTCLIHMFLPMLLRIDHTH